MHQTARIISIYAADTSGFCSALYEYGGMTVIHDASGCNSTYTTHDEPRWYDMDSMMYISGLTESDAVMGNDEKFISDLCSAATELKPAFIAICASPMPAMIGIDMEAIAYEVESRTGIPAFNVRTNGMQSYISGAADAFVRLSDRFTEEIEPNTKNHTISVNILGMTPLDFPLGTDVEIKNWLHKNGFEVNACIGMGTSLEEVKALGKADVNLVVSSIGRPLAERLEERFGIPFVVGVPYGQNFADKLAELLKVAADEKNNQNAASLVREYDEKTVVVGESVLASSLAAALTMDLGIGARVIETVGEGDMSQLMVGQHGDISCDDKDDVQRGDISCDDEDELERELEKSERIVGDPLFIPICQGKEFVRVPHAAFSGRCFAKESERMLDISLLHTSFVKQFGEISE